jgi:hypothetical protein
MVGQSEVHILHSSIALMLRREVEKNVMFSKPWVPRNTNGIQRNAQRRSPESRVNIHALRRNNGQAPSSVATYRRKNIPKPVRSVTVDHERERRPYAVVCRYGFRRLPKEGGEFRLANLPSLPCGFCSREFRKHDDIVKT